ncbi:hypothetical protein QAD02_022598 [Eretmocerus hayati]|uniref:Uncharacterized protein n=1 Tax=Eretmocerus hayati TaxID=131215 RepID=A0ACC2PU46_9HYME|nr:hypothetical protein QAD02_022598 [Eretmocerus hayati]
MSKSKGGICDARCQQFHREVSKKEEALRTRWFLKNRQRLYENLGKHKPFQNVKTAQQKGKVTKTKASTRETEEKPVFAPWRSSKDSQFDLMRPILPAVKSILYVPKDESFLSRKKYFKERYKQNPEDKFFYPQCTSWVYGWRLKDYPPGSSPKFGMKSVIHSTFYRRNASSLQRDPEWYRICQTGDPKNFNEILTY